MSSFDDWIGRNVPDTIMEDAASWMALLDSETCTPADRAAFAQWLGEDLLHQWAFEELSEVWARLRLLPDSAEIDSHQNVLPFPDRVPATPAPQTPAQPREWSTLIAAALVIAGIGINLLAGAPMQTHETRIGERQGLELADGSHIDLNVRTTVGVQIDDRRREVTLDRGEAYFHVAADDRPFIVHTALATVSVVGTEFSIRADDSRVQISVVEGLVSVSATPANIALTEYDGALLRFSDEVALLGAGQRLEITSESRGFTTLSNSRLQDDLSWRLDEIVFDNTPLIIVAAEMRRYHGSAFIIGDPVLNGLRISGRFPTDDVEAFLSQLEDGYGISIERSESGPAMIRLGGPE